MQRTFLGAAMAVAFSAALAAQSSTVKTETKVEVKDGKDVVVTGCLDRAASGTGYTLINAEGRDVTSTAFMLVGKDGDLDGHVGHMVEIRGKASSGKDAKIEVKTKTKIEREHADDKKAESKTEMKGDLIDVPYLGVKSVKMIRANCG
jgi:hypothetical protein